MFIHYFLPTLLCCFGITAGQTATSVTKDKGKCGIRVQDDDPERARVVPTIAGRVPWHVGIYKYDTATNTHQLICGGTIISPDIILTAATCVYDTLSRRNLNPNLFRISAGKLASDWTSPDSDAQEMAVTEFVLPQGFLGNLNSNADNLALLKLIADLRFNDVVRPICFDMNTSNNRQHRYLQTTGWGLDGGVNKWPFLKEANFQYLSNAECAEKLSAGGNSRFITYDKICLLTPGGRTDYDTGGGLVYKQDNKYYLFGTMSDYINNQLTPATNLSRHLTWTNNTVQLFERSRRCKETFRCVDGECTNEALVCNGVLDCPDGTDESYETCPSTKPLNIRLNSCLLPTQNNGEIYTRQFCNSNCILKGGVYVAQNIYVQLNCSEGYIPNVNGLNAEYICTQGRWFPEDPKCIKLCNPLKEPNLNFQCSYNNQVVSCDTLMKPGTVATYSCNQPYQLVGILESSGKLSCDQNGSWEGKIPKCTPKCGLNPAVSVELLISHGSIAKHGEHPWHVAVFRSDNKKTYELVCGGTLISENMVLTAAHCVFSYRQEKKLDVDKVRVVAGKFYSSLVNVEPHEQTRNVSNILVPETYGGEQTRYEHDIALIDTDGAFVLNIYVLPACIDYSTITNSLLPNSTGTLVGWGYTEEDKLSEVLREVQLPIISAVECRNRFKDFQLITADKFCVIYRDGAGSQAGDAGGGMTIKYHGLYFVIGIVSTKSRNGNLYCTLTNVSMHLGWIKQMLNDYPNSQKLH